MTGQLANLACFEPVTNTLPLMSSTLLLSSLSEAVVAVGAKVIVGAGVVVALVVVVGAAAVIVGALDVVVVVVALDMVVVVVALDMVVVIGALDVVVVVGVAVVVVALDEVGHSGDVGIVPVCSSIRQIQVCIREFTTLRVPVYVRHPLPDASLLVGFT